MQTIDLRLDELREAPWNPNAMDDSMLAKLAESIQRYGLVIPVVVRPLGDAYQVLSGNQRLQVLTALDYETVPCVVVDLDDAHAQLLAQALNAIHGDDDQGMKAVMLRTVMESVPESSVLSLLPETHESLTQLVELGEQDIAGYLSDWEQARNARLRHLTFQLVPSQQDIIERALEKATTQTPESGNPNVRGNALFAICQTYLGEQS